jgi:hypothetical protein
VYFRDIVLIAIAAVLTELPAEISAGNSSDAVPTSAKLQVAFADSIWNGESIPN